MKLKLLTAVLLVAAVAFAGTRAKETSGAIPTLSTDGVALTDVSSCRFSARLTDGGTLNGGTLVAYYYDAQLGWVRSATALDCVLEANKLIDGGAPASQVCPDTAVNSRFGRVGVASKNLVNGAGTSVTATVRVECYVPALGNP